jgi:hypothetical protein
MTSERLVAVAVWGAAAHLAATVVALVATDSLGLVVAVVSLALFVVGLAAFARTMLRVADRSRREELSVGGIWFLTGAPPRVKRPMLGALALEVVVAITGASIRPYSVLAFGVFAPVHGLGMCGLWSALHGSFPPRRREGR